MRKSVLVAIATLAATGSLGLLASFDAEAVDECRGRIGQRTVEQVIVPSGAICTLFRTHVEGNVEVKRGATLFATGVRVGGSIQAANAANVRVNQTKAGIRSHIESDVQGFSSGRVSVRNAVVGGNIQLKQNNRFVAVAHNRVGADVQLFTNTGGARVAHNRIDGNLQCKSNQPRPTGIGNVVQGSKEDQCARL
jgi:hypothetical protein